MQVLERVYKEQKQIFQENMEMAEVTTEHLSKMKYLECCIKEALRLYPSVPIIGRRLEKDATIDGQLVKKGTTVIVFVHLLHRNPTIWERPEEFKPERFMESS
jgi:cytochrome P450